MQDLDELKTCFLICAEFEVKKTSVSSFYEENNFKPCLTKQLLNMFNLWCERSINHTFYETIFKPKSFIYIYLFISNIYAGCPIKLRLV